MNRIFQILEAKFSVLIQKSNDINVQIEEPALCSKKNSDLKSEIIILKAKNVYLQKKHKNLLNQLNFQERKMEETTLLFQTFQGVLKDRDKELKEIQEKKRCTVCLNNPSNIVFMKCKHCCICGDCHRTMVENDNMKCPICRESFILNECICIYFS